MSERPIPSTRNRHETLRQLGSDFPELAIPEAELGVMLWSTSAALVRSFEAHLQRYGLSTARFAVLVTLLSAPGNRRSPSELGDRINVRRPTVTGIVDGLETAGLVRRIADPASRRNQLVELTPKGKRAIRNAAPDHFTRLAKAVKSFSPSEQATLRKAMGLMARFGEELAP